MGLEARRLCIRTVIVEHFAGRYRPEEIAVDKSHCKPGSIPYRTHVDGPYGGKNAAKKRDGTTAVVTGIVHYPKLTFTGTWGKAKRGALPILPGCKARMVIWIGKRKKRKKRESGRAKSCEVIEIEVVGPLTRSKPQFSSFPRPRGCREWQALCQTE